MRLSARTRHWQNSLAQTVCVACAVAAIAVLCAILGFITLHGAAAIDLSLLTTVPTGDAVAPGGLLHALVGTIIVLALASAVAIPVGVAVGVQLSEMRTDARLAAVARFGCDVLAGVPSIVLGVLGYELMVVPLGHFSGLAGALVLAIVMIPLVARSCEEVLRLVPDSVREGALALGISPSTTILRVVLPAARSGVLTGVLLAVARAAGETAPLLFTALGARMLTLDPREPFPALTLQIYAYATGPYPAQRTVAWGGMLLLIGMSLAIQLVARAALRTPLAAR